VGESHACMSGGVRAGVCVPALHHMSSAALGAEQEVAQLRRLDMRATACASASMRMHPLPRACMHPACARVLARVRTSMRARRRMHVHSAQCCAGRADRAGSPLTREPQAMAWAADEAAWAAPRLLRGCGTTALLSNGVSSSSQVTPA